jgi:hypothetical protein
MASLGGPSVQSATIDYQLKREGQDYPGGLKGGGGETLLHVTHSLNYLGFESLASGAQANLRAMANSVKSCWGHQFSALKDYAENHLGQTRTVSWAHATAKESQSATWARLTGPNGIVSSGQFAAMELGAKYSFTAPTGDTFSGVVIDSTPDKQFVGTVENLSGGGILRIVLDHVNNEPGVTVWLATYGDESAANAPVFEKRMTDLLHRVLA